MRTPPTLLALVAASALLSACSAARAPDAEPRAPIALPARAVVLSAAQLDHVAAAESPREDALAKSEVEEPKTPDTRPRIASIAAESYIYKHPAAEGLALGYVRMGTSVPLLSDKPVPGKGCQRGWYAVAPRGYICLGRTTTLDLNDPYYRALQTVAPKIGEAWPYHYAFSNGAPMYSRVPTSEEADKAELRFGARGSFVQLAEWSHGHEELIMSEPIAPTDPVPDIFAGGKRSVGGGTRDPRHLLWRVIPNGSMVAYAKAFEAAGRVWLVTGDLMLVPADRVRQLRPSAFHGVDLGKDVALPLAWNRTKVDKPRYRRDADGSMKDAGQPIASKTWVAIEDARVVVGDKAFFAVKGESHTFVAESDVTVSRARKELPLGIEPGEKWIEAKILLGTMTMYEGLTPVRASLFSPGKGGVPVPGMDHTKYATTSIGVFPFEWKDRTATMSSEMSEPKVMWFSDVPHIQYLRAPLAMHVAYWHEDFGNPKSAECVNVSPEDGRWLFDWTNPVLPEGWGGIRPGDGNGKSTAIVVSAQ